HDAPARAAGGYHRRAGRERVVGLVEDLGDGRPSLKLDLGMPVVAVPDVDRRVDQLRDLTRVLRRHLPQIHLPHAPPPRAVLPQSPHRRSSSLETYLALWCWSIHGTAPHHATKLGFVPVGLARDELGTIQLARVTDQPAN